MIKASIIEKYIRVQKGIKLSKTDTIVHDVRYFSNMTTFKQWYNTFKDQLWEDDPSKVKLVEGIYVTTEEVEMDNVTAPKSFKRYATFRQNVSYHYATDELAARMN